MTLLTSGSASSTTGAYVSDERLYLDKDGKPVGPDDPGRVELLVGAGGTLPRARAVELGLITPDQAAQAAHDETLEALTPAQAGADTSAPEAHAG